MPHPATLDDESLLRDCTQKQARRSGPGGQHRNKVETAVILYHKPTGVSAEASERRSKAENQRVAVRRLRMRLAIEVRSEPDSEESPSELWRSRVRKGRIAINAEHRDLPSLIAEALDVLGACEWDTAAASQGLGCSATQLVKLLKIERGALDKLNAQRKLLGLHPLK